MNLSHLGNVSGRRAAACTLSRSVRDHKRAPSVPNLAQLTLESDDTHKREAARSVKAAAATHAAEAVQLVDSIVHQATPHDSLLKSGSSAFWSYLDSAASNDSSTAVRTVAAAVSRIPEVPFAVKSSFADVTDKLTATLASAGLTPDLSPLRTAADAALRSLHASQILTGGGPSLPSVSLPTPGYFVPVLPDLTNSALFNGTFSETQAAAIIAAIIAISAISSATSATPGSGAGVASDADLPMDRIFGEEKKNEAKRARTLRLAIDRLGPAYIKVAQALSTRVDLLSPAYFNEITLLQDRVAPFPSKDAMAIIEEELGAAPAQLFSKITPEPVASASLGQVYRATLRETGEEVALKVQRPGCLELVALDLVLGRRGILIADKLFPRMTRAEDILPVLDEWAFKFYREMDYRKEAAMIGRFQKDLESLEGIVIPRAYSTYTTRRVLCTQWMEGEKLSESRAEDVKELCTTLLNAYLIQLLDTGLLHADPHPGNLIRTPEGKICILDFGLVTEVPAKLRIYILEYMAHLSLKDWKAVGDDFVKLQFVAEDSKNPNEVPGLMDSVGVILDLLMGGGGMQSLDKVKSRELVDMVGVDVEELEEKGFMDGFSNVLTNLSNPSKVGASDSSLDQERRRKIRKLNEEVRFRLPPYFVLILRAFSVIEGIALKVDPGYSIINETFPYLSRRLLTDDNEEVRRALRQVLYGDGKRMNLSRFRTLFDSLQSFTTDGLTKAPAKPAASSRTGTSESLSLHSPLDQNTLLALQSVFNAQGTSYIQQLLVTELAATLESLSRGAAVSLLQSALRSSLTNGTLALIDRLGPLRRLVLPFPVPAEIITSLGDVVTLTEEDEIAIANVQAAWSFLQPQLTASFSPGNLQMSLIRSFASTVGELPQETRASLVAGAGRTSQMILEKVVQRTAVRFAEDLESVRAQQGALAGILGGRDIAGMPASTLPGMQDRRDTNDVKQS